MVKCTVDAGLLDVLCVFAFLCLIYRRESRGGGGEISNLYHDDARSVIITDIV